MSTKINKFVIFGERCSGTNFLEEAITRNFNLQLSNDFGNKHFFCFNNFKNINTNNILFIGIVRNPIHWLNSFYMKPYHVPVKNRELNRFLFSSFYSVKDEEQPKMCRTIKKDGSMIFSFQKNSEDVFEINENDLNYKTGTFYKNIFELRKNKNEYLMKIIKTKVKNYILINYENLLYNYEETLNDIKQRFDLEQSKQEYEHIKGYKKSTTDMFKGEKEITFDKNTILNIWKNLDMKQENSLGYFIGDNNAFFRNKYKNQNVEDKI